MADSIGFSPGVDLPKPSAGGPQVPAGLGTFGISCRLLPVAPASSGLSLSRSRWMLAKWLGAEPVSMHVAGVRAEAGCSANSARENGAPERIRTSDPQIRSLVLYPAELRARGVPRERQGRDIGGGLDARNPKAARLC